MESADPWPHKKNLRARLTRACIAGRAVGRVHTLTRACIASVECLLGFLKRSRHANASLPGVLYNTRIVLYFVRSGFPGCGVTCIVPVPPRCSCAQEQCLGIVGQLYLVAEQTNRWFTANQGVLFTPLFQSTERVILAPLDIDGSGGEGSHDSAGVHHNT